MGGMEFNKIFAALLVAGIIAMFSGFMAKQLTAPHELKEDAYPIEGVESAGGSAKVEKVAEPILAMLADADVARGQKVAKACAACHSFNQGGANGVGPNLWNIVGRQKQNVAGFSYSGTLNSQGGDVWTYAELNKYLWKPKKYAPGTKMNYVGLKKPEDRAAIVAWLRTLAPAPKALPSSSDVAVEEAELSPAKEEPASEATEGDSEAVTQGGAEGQKDLDENTDDLEEVKEAVETIKDVVKDADSH